jgi:hypothetical protein
MDGSMNLEAALEERLRIIDCTPADIKRFILAHPPETRLVPVSRPSAPTRVAHPAPRWQCTPWQGPSHPLSHSGISAGSRGGSSQPLPHAPGIAPG